MTRNELKSWLKEKHGNDRQWLADQCGKSINTVYTWFSTRPIPSDAEKIIRRLMEKDHEDERLHTALPSSLVLHFHRSDFKKLQEAARFSGNLVDEWAEDRLREIADEEIEIQTRDLERFQAAAEDKAPYKKTKKPNLDHDASA